MKFKLRATRNLAALKRRRRNWKSKSDDLIGQQMEPIIKEGQSLEQKIQEKEGSTIRKDMIFESAGVIVLKAGETIDAKLLSIVQDAVKAKLEEVEGEVKSQIEAEVGKIDILVEKIRSESELNIANLAEQLDEIKLQIKSQLDQRRNELEDLAPFKFLSENQYRDLKSRYGQVFRADMGAESLCGYPQPVGYG